MLSIKDVRNYMTVWRRQTYCSALEYCYSIKNDKQVYDLTLEVLKLQGLESKFMDGHSIERIPIINEGRIHIVFSRIFWDMIDQYITPVYYIALIVKNCLRSGIDEPEQIAGIVGRGLRSLPSFLRELDLTYKLVCLFPQAEILNGPEQDVWDHTDLLIKSHGGEYRLWSYQNSPRGLENTAARFYGRRGELPKGYHVLCPIDISNGKEVEELEGWYFYSEQYVRFLYDMISIEKPDDYNTVSSLQMYAMRIYLNKAKIVRK